MVNAVNVDPHVVYKLGNVGALSRENKFRRGVIDANNSFATWSMHEETSESR